MNTQLFKNKKASSLLLSLLILTAILTIGFGISSLLLVELKMTRNVPESLRAYYAAESGIERALYEERKGSGASDIGNPPSCSDEDAVCLDNQACYSVKFTSGDPDVIKSYGCFRGIKRAIEVTY